MGFLKKILCTLLAMAVFILVTVGFAAGLRDNFPRNRNQREQLVYTRPAAVPTEETAQTEPPETEPPETEPPTTEPPATEPPQTDPPATDPPPEPETDPQPEEGGGDPGGESG